MLKNTYINKRYYDSNGMLNKVLLLRTKKEVETIINNSLIPNKNRAMSYYYDYKNNGYFLAPNGLLFMVKVHLNLNFKNVIDIELLVADSSKDIVFKPVSLESTEDYINYLTK